MPGTLPSPPAVIRRHRRRTRTGAAIGQRPAIQGLSPRSGTYAPYASTSTLRYTATSKRTKKRFKGKRRRPHISDILIVRQI